MVCQNFEGYILVCSILWCVLCVWGSSGSRGGGSSAGSRVGGGSGSHDKGGSGSRGGGRSGGRGATFGEGDSEGQSMHGETSETDSDSDTGPEDNASGAGSASIPLFDGGAAGVTAHTGRGYSSGIFGDILERPIRIRLPDEQDEPALRTCLGIMRAHFLDDCFTATKVDMTDKTWWDLIINEFFLYYTYDPVFGSYDDAVEAVRYHARANYRRIFYNEKKYLRKRLTKNEGTTVISVFALHMELTRKRDLSGSGSKRLMVRGRTRYCSYHASKQAMCSARVPRHRGEDSSGRSIVSRMRDALFLEAIDRTVGYARDHPQEFGLNPDHIRMLASQVAEGEPELPSDHPLSLETMRELVHVIVTLFNDIYKRDGPGRRKGKAVTRDGDNRPPSPDYRPLSPSSQRGGPVIHG